MNIAPQEKSIRGLMFATVAVGANMCGLQGRQGSFLGYRTTATIDFSHKNAERTLPKPGFYEMWYAEPYVVAVHACGAVTSTEGEVGLGKR